MKLREGIYYRVWLSVVARELDTASDVDGSVLSAQFYKGRTLIGKDS